MKRFTLEDSETNVQLTINQESVSQDELLSLFRDFMVDCGYEIADGYGLAVVETAGG